MRGRTSNSLKRCIEKMISIIIPTLNEEKYLPHLLKSIKEQDFFSNPEKLEIIVADAGSEDKTVEIAKSFGCQITKGGLPAKGKNEGAKIARGDLFLFLDSDVILDKNYLKKALKEFRERKLSVASGVLKSITRAQAKSKELKFFLTRSNELMGEDETLVSSTTRAQAKGGDEDLSSSTTQEKVINFIYHYTYNLPIFLLENILPHAANFILIKKELHQKIGGFDEEIKLAEDQCYVREAAKIGKFGILRETTVFLSPRRFEKEGWLKVVFKLLLAELHLIFLGPIKSDIFCYRFSSHSSEKSNKKGPKILELFLGVPVLIIWVLFVFFALLIGGLKNIIKKCKI